MHTEAATVLVVEGAWHREMLNKYREERRGDSRVECCSKDTAVNTSTHVTEEVKCGSVQPESIVGSNLVLKPLPEVNFPPISSCHFLPHLLSPSCNICHLLPNVPFSTLQLPYSEDGLRVPVPEEMSLGRLLRRASSKASDLLTFNPGAGGSSLRSGLDGEIIFSKNHVCVHPAEPLPGLAEHHPGLATPTQFQSCIEVRKLLIVFVEVSTPLAMALDITC